MSKLCVKCGDNIHPKRLQILPNTMTCVSCSTTGQKRGISVQLGEGDHTYNEIVILEENEFRKYLELEQSHRKTLNNQLALEALETKEVTPESENEDEFDSNIELPDVSDIPELPNDFEITFE
jgi:hypothetical protein